MSDTADKKPHEIIADWREAYIAANGDEPRYSVVYRNGWYRFGYMASYRKTKVLAMTATLRRNVRTRTGD